MSSPGTSTSAAEPGTHPALHGESAYAPDTSRPTEPGRRVVLVRVAADVLEVESLARAVEAPAAGAVVTFAGVVRDHDHGRAVTGIEYVAHPAADRVLGEVAAAVAAAHPVDALAVAHRLGHLAVGDAALVVAVAAAHRGEAFAAASALVDEVKHRLPVWKHQLLADGTDEWVACP